jgi:hypothetical protein
MVARFGLWDDGYGPESEPAGQGSPSGNAIPDKIVCVG